MLLEWVRRQDGKLSGQFKTYLFSEKPITGH
jgi:hypothetical protein